MTYHLVESVENNQTSFVELPIDGNLFLDHKSSFGLDFWHSSIGRKWVGSFLNSKPFSFKVTNGADSASLHCLLRRLPGNYYLASAYPYASIQGNAALIWGNIPILQKALRERRIIKLEMPFAGEYADQSIKDHTKIAEYRNSSLDAVRHVIDISHAKGDLKWLDNHFGRKIRWAVNKSKRSGCTVREATAEEVDIIQKLYVKTMRAKGAPVNYSAERFEGIITSLSPKGLGKVYVGCVDNKPAGFAAVVDGTISRHFIQLAVPPEAQSYRLSELLVSTVIQDAVVIGKSYFDFMASQKDDKGLISFKAKWGAKEEDINYVTIVAYPLLSQIVSLMRWGNKLRGKFNASKAHS